MSKICPKKNAAAAMVVASDGNLRSTGDCNVIASRYEMNSESAVIHTNDGGHVQAHNPLLH
jgi:hypothetical protein